MSEVKMRICIGIGVLCLVMLLFLPAEASAIYHIAPYGDDFNDGSLEHPWKSLSKINDLLPGDSVIIHGSFNEAVDIEVSGEKGAPITIIGDDALIDGSGIGRDGFVLRPNASFIIIKNLRITNFSDNWGLALYGNNSHVTIEDVEVDNCDTGIHLTAGYSGQPPIFGAVDNVTIKGVKVHDNGVGGLDCTPGPCYYLTILNSSFYNNGAQGFGADGIAVEVGDNILIQNVTAFNNGGDGIDLCSRNPLFIQGSANVTVRECVVANNGMQGLKLWSGGRAINCLMHSNGLEGLVIVYNGDYIIQHCDVVKNALLGGYAVTSGYPEPEPLGMQNAINLTFQNSIFAFNGYLGEGNPAGIWISDRTRFKSENCIYFSRDFEEIYFKDTSESITREQIRGGELGINFGEDPGFVDLEGNDYHLKEDSVAIDNGTLSGVMVDLDYRGRPTREGYDIGCYEFSEGVPTPISTPTLTMPPVSPTPPTLTPTPKLGVPGFEALPALIAIVGVCIGRIVRCKKRR